jgi:hypothetical protein
MGTSKHRSSKQFKVSNLIITWIYQFINHCVSPHSIIQSFEVVVYLYAQQLSLDEPPQNFTLPLLTLVAELVNTLSTISDSNYNA